MGGAIPALVALGTISKKAEEATRNKSGRSILPWLRNQLPPSVSCPTRSPALTSLTDELLPESVSEIYLPDPKVALGYGVSLQQ